MFNNKKTFSKIMKDNEDQQLDGVFSGLSKHTGIDTVVLRAIFVITMFSTGFILPLVIYWIFSGCVVPDYDPKFDLSLKSNEKNNNEKVNNENLKSVFIKEI
jgi:phage shock protein PspC (stress-responsive transcriptional regulator)